MHDLLGFDKMLTPIIIRVLYFLGLLFALGMGVSQILAGHVLTGLLIALLGAVGARVTCELLILAFRIYDTLRSIESKLGSPQQNVPAAQHLPPQDLRAPGPGDNF